MQAIGTLISGTHRQQDLIPAFLSELERVNKWEARALTDSVQGGIAIPEHAKSDEGHDWWRSDDAIELSVALMETLWAEAPVFLRFGAHEADGSDYGYWVDDVSIEIAEIDGDLKQITSLDQVTLDHPFHLLIDEDGSQTLYKHGKGVQMGEQIALWSTKP